MSNLKLMMYPTDQRQSIVSNSKHSILSPNRKSKIGTHAYSSKQLMYPPD